MKQFNDYIETLFKEYSEVDSIVQAKNKFIKDKQADLKNSIQGKSIDELEDLLIHTYVDTTLYNKDLQILFVRLICNIDTYKSLYSELLSEDIEAFYTKMRQWMPKRLFKVEKGELVESETGVLEEERKKFIESDFLKGLKSNINSPQV